MLWYAAVVICSAGMLGWLRAVEISYQYWSLPHSPNPATGNVYPLNIHGYVVYQTLKEQVRRERWEFWSLEVAGFGIALGVFQKWLTERRQRK
jgi:hypothetical protein